MAPPSLHATAVAIDGEALLILGPSRAGKSRLAAALIARGTVARPIVLIGDDRILLCERSGAFVARPHPRIAGFLERRGLGIVAMDWVAEAPVGGVIDLRTVGHSPSPPAGGISEAGDGVPRDAPRLRLRPLEADPDRVLAWWDGRAAAAASHLPQKRAHDEQTCAKD